MLRKYLMRLQCADTGCAIYQKKAFFVFSAKTFRLGSLQKIETCNVYKLMSHEMCTFIF